jgi:tetratricopeptide (TPR) repeat protein
MPIIQEIQELKTIDKISFIVGIVGFLIGIFGICTWFVSSNEVPDLQKQLDQAKMELNQSIISNRYEIILAMHESDDIGLNTTARNNYFLYRFGIPYDKASQILDFSNKTDDYSLGISSLDHSDYNTSLNHFNLALIKDPLSVESKIGKSAALIGLNRSTDARNILVDIGPIYKNKAYVNKLIGDSYYNEGDYKNATDYYLVSVNAYQLDPQDESNLFERLGVIKSNGLYNTSQVSVSYYQGGKGKVIAVYFNNSGMAYTKMPGPD